MSQPAALPQLDGPVYLTDGGMETTLIFRRGLVLPYFAAFTLLADDSGARELRDYYDAYLDVADEAGLGLVLDTATWRANRDWGAVLGYEEDDLAGANIRAVRLLAELRAARPQAAAPVLVNGAVGPRGDGYRVDRAMSREAAHRYHAPQVRALAAAGADVVTALTMAYAEEAAGVARAAADEEVPAAVSFTVETDGRLPSGQPLAEAIEQVDADAEVPPAYFMVNCAHPSHFAHVLAGEAPALDRVRGVRANASRKSHAELDEAAELDEGDPAALAAELLALRARRPGLSILGGCCGTDHRHVAAIASAL